MWNRCAHAARLRARTQRESTRPLPKLRRHHPSQDTAKASIVKPRPTRTTVVRVRLTPQERLALELLARKRGESLSLVLRDAIRAAIDQAKLPPTS